MAYPEFRHYLPRSLFSRAALIVLLPLILLQLLVSFVFVQRHFDGVTRQMSRSIAREIAVAQQVIDTSPTSSIAQLRLLNLSQPLAIPFDLDAQQEDPGPSRRHWYDLSGRALTEELRALLGREDVSVDLTRDRRLVLVRLRTEKGLLEASIPRVRTTASNPHQLLVVMVFASLILIAIAFLFLRNQIRPINELANVSEAFGKGRSLPYRPAGAEQIRRAGTAFLSMRSRIERQIEQRTQMLTGVSHDLRTPLTRLKLSLELMEDAEDLHHMIQDVRDMEDMLDAFLAFARGEREEEPTRCEPVEIAREIAASFERGGSALDLVLPTEPTQQHATLRKSGVMRAVQNLLNNAAHYGEKIRLTLKLMPKTCEFIIEDDGPGIPEDRREDVFKPFLRLDASRNLNKGGGVGLGLSIALDIAHAHGGALELSTSKDLGGLRATLRLPR